MKKFAILAVSLLASAVFAADTVRVGGINAPVNSSSGSSVTTNGVYALSIAGSSIVTNLVLLNPGSYYADRDICLQFQAQATGATTTNAVFVLSSTVQSISITNGANGTAGSSSPRGTFLTVTLPLNGTTPVTTNIVLSPSSSPAFANGLNVYLESIQMGTSAQALTNYSVTVSQ